MPCSHLLWIKMKNVDSIADNRGGAQRAAALHWLVCSSTSGHNLRFVKELVQRGT